MLLKSCSQVRAALRLISILLTLCLCPQLHRMAAPSKLLSAWPMEFRLEPGWSSISCDTGLACDIASQSIWHRGLTACMHAGSKEADQWL